MATQKPPGLLGSSLRLFPFKRIIGVFSILCTVIYVGIWIGETVKTSHEKWEWLKSHEPSTPQPPNSVQLNVQRQIEQIKQVNAQYLGLTFMYDLMMWDCDFPFHCAPNKSANEYAAFEAKAFPSSMSIRSIPRASFADSVGGTNPKPKTGVDAQVEETLRLLPKPQPSPARQPVTISNPAYDEPPSPEEYAYAAGSQNRPKFFVMTPVPTWHTLLGAPRAAFVTVRAIFRAGGWAIAIFAACGILYFCLGTPLIVFLARKRGKKGWENAPTIVFVLLLASPFVVPFIVGGVQWTAEALGSAVSWMVGLWVMAATWSAAISVLVGIPHVWKAPREVKEAYHVVRHGVAAIEKD